MRMNQHYNIQFHDQAIGREKEILDLLTKVIDPELGIDIVNMGLIYEVTLDEAGKCSVIMTLTTMGCPLVDYIVGDIKFALEHLPGVEKSMPLWDRTELGSLPWLKLLWGILLIKLPKAKSF